MCRREAQRRAGMGCLVAMLTVTLVAASCSESQSDDADVRPAQPTGVEITPGVVPLTNEQQAALHALTSSDATGLVDAPATHGHESMHGGHGPAGAETMPTSAPSDELERELAVARRAAATLMKEPRL